MSLRISCAAIVTTAVLAVPVGEAGASNFVGPTGTPTTVSVIAASADTPGCVTRREFRKVSDGMRKRRVHRIFDTRGEWLSGGGGVFSRWYVECRPDPGYDECRAEVEYRRTSTGGGRVRGKWWSTYCTIG